MISTCAVTGATGYVGAHITQHLRRAGWTVRTLGRHGCDVRFDLGGAVAPDSLAGADALVHVSYDFSPKTWNEIERINVRGTRQLLDAARQAGIKRIVSISSVAAFPGARSKYGHAKLEIEHETLVRGGCVVRPGLVWGEQGAAMFGTLNRVMRALPIVPLPAPPDLDLVMVHESDLSDMVVQILERWPVAAGQLVVAGADRTITFAALLRLLAHASGREPRFVRLPWRGVWLGLITLERCGVDPPFRSDSLVSLVATDRDPLSRATISPQQLGVQFRPYTGSGS